MKKEKTSQFFSNNSQLLIPLIAILLLVIFNLFRDPSFFSVGIAANNNGDPVLQGNLISILNGASELVVLSMGMTLVTAASGGQDISVGALAAIAGSVFVKVLKGGAITPGTVLAAFLACCAVAMIFGAFNGSMVAFFRIQPMIATLILFTCGRSIAYWINGRAPDYDDWSLNGDLIVNYPLLGIALEISSMGIRVDEETLARQLEIAGCTERAELPFHKALLAGELPYTIGGGIGQSRVCMYCLRKAHIGEVQASLWPAEMEKELEESGIILL